MDVSDNPVQKLDSIAPYFKEDKAKNRRIFVGESLEIRIPKRFEIYGLLDITDKVRTLGIMDLIIDGKYEASLNILCPVVICPSEIDEMTIDGVPYLVLYLEHGDIFIDNDQVPQTNKAVYSVYVEFITRGKPLYTFHYRELALIFDRAKELTGSGIGVDRVLFELIVSHLARDKNDLFKQYRYTDMKDPPQFIPMRSVIYAPSNTTTRMVGSYSDDGTVAAAQTQTTTDQPFENIFRGIPQGL